MSYVILIHAQFRAVNELMSKPLNFITSIVNNCRILHRESASKANGYLSLPTLVVSMCEKKTVEKKPSTEATFSIDITSAHAIVYD